MKILVYDNSKRKAIEESYDPYAPIGMHIGQHQAYAQAVPVKKVVDLTLIGMVKAFISLILNGYIDYDDVRKNIKK